MTYILLELEILRRFNSELLLVILLFIAVQLVAEDGVVLQIGLRGSEFLDLRLEAAKRVAVVHVDVLRPLLLFKFLLILPVQLLPLVRLALLCDDLADDVALVKTHLTDEDL
jgi:hypothetical protein